MLGRQEEVERLLAEDPQKIHARGAHGIPLLAHAALSGNVDLARLLVSRGAREGMSYALSNAVNRGDPGMTRWLLENGAPDLQWKNYQGKTALEIAVDRGFSEIAGLLGKYQAMDQPESKADLFAHPSLGASALEELLGSQSEGQLTVAVLPDVSIRITCPPGDLGVEDCSPAAASLALPPCRWKTIAGQKPG
jgi:ankyrin repeat protein